METIANVVLLILTIIMGAVLYMECAVQTVRDLIAMMIAIVAHFQDVMMLQERMWISSDFYYR